MNKPLNQRIEEAAKTYSRQVDGDELQFNHHFENGANQFYSEAIKDVCEWLGNDENFGDRVTKADATWFRSQIERKFKERI